MRISPLSHAAGFFLVGLAGCAASQTVDSTALIPSYGKDDIQQAKLFVSDFYASQVIVYPAHLQNPAPISVISSGVSNPYNLAVDATGKLYVQNNNNTITEYPKGHSAPIKTLTEPPAGPGGLGTGICVTVGRNGTVYAADHYAGQVYEFAHGSMTPTTTLYVSEAFGLALDSRNDLYVGWSNSSSGAAGHVMRFKPGSSIGHDLGITVKLSGGLAVDSNDHLLVGDQGQSLIDIFKLGATKPYRMIDTAPNPPYQFALDRGERHLYLISGTPAEVYVYDYATGAPAWTITQGLPGPAGYAMGVALRPSAKQ